MSGVPGGWRISVDKEKRHPYGCRNTGKEIICFGIPIRFPGFLTFGELGSSSRLVLPVFLSLYHTIVPSEKAFLLQGASQAGIG